MIEEAGLRLVFTAHIAPGERRVYYMGMVRSACAAPSWLQEAP